MRIEQSCEYAGEDRWRWSVWLDGTDAELDEVEYVEYVLHTTFSDPVRRITDRSTNFRLDSEGWGEFEVYAHAFTRSGETRRLQQWLRLEYPAGTEPAAAETGRDQPLVFVSYAAADAAWGQAIEAAFKQNGVDAVSTDDVMQPGRPWAASVASAADGADLVIGVFSDEPSPRVEREVSAASKNDVTVVPITVGKHAIVPEWLDTTAALPVDTPADVSPAVDELTSRYLG